MTPIDEVLELLKQTSAADFAARHASEDLILVEPYEKNLSYGGGSPLHSGGTVRFVRRQAGIPIPAGRDARSTILLDHRSISRLHAVIAYTDEGWKVMDKSSNGCYLSEERIVKEQATDLPYETPLRLGKAVVVRVFQPQHFFGYATGSAPVGGSVRNGQTASSAADTWRIPLDQIQAAANNPTAPPPAPPAPLASPTASRFDLDFDFGGDGPQGKPTMRFERPSKTPGALPPLPPPPAAAPAPPPPPPPPAEGADFDFEFDFDGKGGFA